MMMTTILIIMMSWRRVGRPVREIGAHEMRQPLDTRRLSTRLPSSSSKVSQRKWRPFRARVRVSHERSSATPTRPRPLRSAFGQSQVRLVWQRHDAHRLCVRRAHLHVCPLFSNKIIHVVDWLQDAHWQEKGDLIFQATLNVLLAKSDDDV